MKRLLKKSGMLFFNLRQEKEGILGQSVLIIDNGYSWLGQLSSAIERIRNYFPKAEISVLTFEQRRYNLQRDFPTLQFILPSQRLKPKRYQVALQMLKMRKKRYDFITLLSLDVTPLIAALIFLKSKVALYNQWGQWWSLSLRNVSEFFKTSYIRKRRKFTFKNLLKKIGLFFVLLQREDIEALRHSILVVDNGYALSEQIGCALQQIRESLPGAKVSVVAFEERKQLKDNFPELEIIQSGKCIIERYRIARHMFRLRRNRYDYIIPLSLDITPILVSILFMKDKVLLYNQWHQWWSVKPKSIKGYLTVLPRFIFNIIIFAYLLISVSWIFLKKSFNVFKFGLSGKRS